MANEQTFDPNEPFCLMTYGQIAERIVDAGYKQPTKEQLDHLESYFRKHLWENEYFESCDIFYGEIDLVKDFYATYESKIFVYDKLFVVLEHIQNSDDLPEELENDEQIGNLLDKIMEKAKRDMDIKHPKDKTEASEKAQSITIAMETCCHGGDQIYEMRNNPPEGLADLVQSLAERIRELENQ